MLETRNRLRSKLLKTQQKVHLKPPLMPRCQRHRQKSSGLILVILLFSCDSVACLKGPSYMKIPKKDDKSFNNLNDLWSRRPGSLFNLDDTGSRFDLDYFKSEESYLRGYLMANYSMDVRPVVNVSTVTYVNITLTIIQIMDLDEQNQVMITNAQITLKWYDQHLVWDPNLFNNQSRIVFSSKDIWTPDIVLFNSADVAYSTQRDNYLIQVNYDGSVMWMFPDILRSYCRVDIKYFPFDRQNCTLELQSWSRTKKEVVVFYNNEIPFQNHSYIHTEWKLLNITMLALEQNDYVWLEFMIHLKRNHAFYVNHMIFPFAILSSLTLFVFWLPPDSGEKITLTITILLALTVFLQLITEYTPKAAKSLPIIGLYFNLNLILVLISVILTIIVLNFHFRGPKKQRVPRWMRKYIIGYLGRIFCFCYESKAFCRINEEEELIIQINRNQKKALKNAAKNLQLHRKLDAVAATDHETTDPNEDSLVVSDKSNSSEFLNIQSSQLPAYITSSTCNRSNATAAGGSSSNKSSRIVLEFHDDNEIKILSKNSQPAQASSSSLRHQQQQQQSQHSLNRNQNQQQRSFANYARSQSTSFKNTLPDPLHSLNQPIHRSSSLLDSQATRLKSSSQSLAVFNEDITKNLEKMLMKMQKSFDPFKIQDHSLKFAILKEILECQRLLLTANLASKKETQISINEIYDEWKILAMIVDRVCFFVYLTALVVSSGLFVLSEQIYDNHM